MIRTLAIKELRETAWIWLLGAAWLFVVAMDAMRMPILPEASRYYALASFRSQTAIPFYGGEIPMGIGVGMGLLGIALGIRQSAGETWTGTYPLVLHLPIARQRLFAIKLAVGLGLVWGLGAAALGVICWWAATPGTHASPFDWAMTADAWRTWFAMPLVYLGAFATGLLPARWFGIRLFPLLASCVTTGVLLAAANLSALPLLAFVGCVAATGLVFRIVIGHQAAVRDFS